MNTTNSGFQPMNVNAVLKETGKGRGSEARMCHNGGKLGHLNERLLAGQWQENWRQRKGQEWQEQRHGKSNKGTGSGGPKRLLFGTRNIVNCWEASTLLVKVRLVKMTGLGTPNTGTNSKLKLELEV